MKQTALPLDKVVHRTQLLAFRLATKESRMVVQFAAASKFRVNASFDL
jgi:hypothetical protein